MSSPTRSRLSRRQLLIGGSAAAGAALLGACGSSDDGAATSTTTTPGGDGDRMLAQFFGGPMFVAGQESRLAFGVHDQDGLLPADQVPERLRVEVLGADGSAIGRAVDVDAHAEGLAGAYFPLRVTIEEPGFYTARAELDGSAPEFSFQIHAPGDVQVIQPGAAMPAVDTPTTADARGVEPICTRDPVCPLHDVTLTEALAEGTPVALLVATPAFCQISICGPVLEVLLDVRDDHPDVRFLHAEVYTDPYADLQSNAPIVEQLGLHFEPCLVLVGADGQVVERLDTIYDRGELRSRIDILA